MKKIGVSEFKLHLAKIMGEAYVGNQFLLERNGMPLAVLIGIHEYQQLQEDFEDIKDMLEAITEDDWVDFDEVIEQKEQQDVQNSSKQERNPIALFLSCPLNLSVPSKVPDSPGALFRTAEFLQSQAHSQTVRHSLKA